MKSDVNKQKQNNKCKSFSLVKIRGEVIYSAKINLKIKVGFQTKKKSVENSFKQPFFNAFRMVRVTGLEPARGYHQNLNLACLPIPPHPQLPGYYITNKKVMQVFFNLTLKDT